MSTEKILKLIEGMPIKKVHTVNIKIENLELYTK
jgi:hypothetical protein